ncbi:hypothetical protein GY45DRAFT_113836 [Cubamyces sp. BRFM 1775]|nr:hypothetical protein GY45DRAFT_113836 [Cubamyces sp. BRFM 1775]
MPKCTRSGRHLPMEQCGPDKHRQRGSSASNIAHMPLPSAFSHSVLSSQKPVPMTLRRPGDIVIPRQTTSFFLARLSAANSPVNMFRCPCSKQNGHGGLASRSARRSQYSLICAPLPQSLSSTTQMKETTELATPRPQSSVIRRRRCVASSFRLINCPQDRPNAGLPKFACHVPSLARFTKVLEEIRLPSNARPSRSVPTDPA